VLQEVDMKLTVPAIRVTAPDDQRQGSAQETVHLLEAIDALLAEALTAAGSQLP
jgi:hypothetical protein